MTQAIPGDVPNGDTADWMPILDDARLYSDLLEDNAALFGRCLEMRALLEAVVAKMSEKINTKNPPLKYTAL